MKPLQRRNSLLLVLAAFIWGIAFVAQSEGENQSVLIHSTASLSARCRCLMSGDFSYE